MPMNRMPCLFALFALLISVPLLATPGIEWSRTFTEAEFASIVDVIQTSDGGFAIFGRTQTEPRNNQLRLLKLSRDGEIEWDYVSTEIPSVNASSLIEAFDGGFFLTGTWKLERESRSYIRLLKLSLTGQLEWWTGFGIDGFEFLYPQAFEIHPGSFIVLATAVGGNGNALFRLETEEGHISGGSVSCPDLGSRVVTGLSHPAIGTRLTLSAREGSAASGDRTGVLISLPATGVCGWIQPIEGPGAGFAYDVEETLDGELLVVGSASLAGSGADIYVSKYDTEGTQLWYHTYGGESADFSGTIVATADGGAVIVGTSLDYEGRSGVLVFRLDPEGEMLWEIVFGGRYDVGASIHRTTDGGYIIGVNCGPEGYGCSGIRIIKFAPDLE